jgi:high-affinity K+ transport system ATPase subunit B
MNERFDELRRMGIRTVMITGDNRVTAAVIAQERASTTSSPRRRRRRSSP